MRCEHAYDDGAYVLGALSPAERDRFETHLATCHRCREAVAGLAVLPGLLGRLSPTDVPTALTSHVSEQRLPKLVHEATLRRRRQRRQVIAAGLLTASVAAFVGLAAGSARQPRQTVVLPPTVTASPSPSKAPRYAMYQVGEVPILAEISLTDTAFGTQVWMKCWYPDNGDHYRAWDYFLVAIGPNGEVDQVATWKAAPGEEATIPGGMVRFQLRDLNRLEIRNKYGTPLMAYDVP